MLAVPAWAKSFLARKMNPARARMSQMILPMRSTLGQLAAFRYGSAVQASVAPEAAANRWTSPQAGRDDHQTNSVKAIAAQPTPAKIAIQNGWTGFGRKFCVMSSYQTNPITKAVSPASHAGTVLRRSSGEGRPKSRARYAKTINARIASNPTAIIPQDG